MIQLLQKYLYKKIRQCLLTIHIIILYLLVFDVIQLTKYIHSLKSCLFTNCSYPLFPRFPGRTAHSPSWPFKWERLSVMGIKNLEADVWKVSFGCGPLTVTVTTKIITFLVGDPYKPLFPTVKVRGPHPRYPTVTPQAHLHATAIFVTVMSPKKLSSIKQQKTTIHGK